MIIKKYFHFILIFLNKQTNKMAEKKDVDKKKPKKTFLGLFQDKQSLIDSLPKITILDAGFDTKKLKFHSGVETPALGHRYLFAGYDEDAEIVYGHVRMFENEWGTIDVDELQRMYLSKGNSMMGFSPFVETFKSGPKTIAQLKKMGWEF